MSRWMDTRGETIISRELVHVGGLGNIRASFLPVDVVEKIPLEDMFTCKFHRLRVYGSD